jgi:hypothetical protein
MNPIKPTHQAAFCYPTKMIRRLSRATRLLPSQLVRGRPNPFAAAFFPDGSTPFKASFKTHPAAAGPHGTVTARLSSCSAPMEDVEASMAACR